MIDKIATKILQYQNAKRYCQRPAVQSALKHFNSVEQNRLIQAIPLGGFHDEFAKICAEKRMYSLLAQKYLRQLARERKLEYASASRLELILRIEDFEARKFTWLLTLMTPTK